MLLLLEQALAYLTEILGITQIIQGLLKPVAIESLPKNIEAIVTASALLLENPTYGVAGLYTQQATNYSSLVTALSGLAADIALAQTAALPVILPTTPPTGYGGGLVSGDVPAIWAYVSSDGAGYSMGDLVDDAGFLAQNLGQLSSFKTPYGDYVRQHYDLSTETLIGPSYSPPIIDPSTIVATDANVVDWLNRTDTGGFTWEYLNNLPISYTGHTISDQWWICEISDYQFSLYKAALTPLGVGAPLWPGLANVTLGTPVALTTALDVAVVMHGAIITLTAVPPGKPTYTLGSAVATAHIGQITFVDDDDHVEYPQNLSFASEVYVPVTMVKASGAKVRCVPGVSGTITPWTIT